MVDERAYWIALSLIPGIGPIRLRRLLDTFGSAAAAWVADEGSLARAGLDQRSLQSVLLARRQIDPAAEIARVERLGVSALIWTDSAYPARLREIESAPPVLYVRGDLSPADETAIAIVGTRRASVYGREVAGRFARELAAQGITVVSGLAKGIDAAAHRGALEAGGRTIAVLACGLDQIYPPEHARLAREIIANGALVSDYPLGVRPEASNFPARNRLISGLSLGVLVVEAGERSGALITADAALDQGREVFAVPGNVTSPLSRGTNRLIQQGAKLVQSVEDVLEELHLQAVSQQLEMKLLLPETGVEAAILQVLSADPQHVDVVRRRVGLPIAEVTSTLAIMELKGLVRQVGTMHFVRT